MMADYDYSGTTSSSSSVSPQFAPGQMIPMTEPMMGRVPPSDDKGDMGLYPVGTTVYLRPDSQYYSQAPDNRPGIIENNENGGVLNYTVRWENGGSNTYSPTDISDKPILPTPTSNTIKVGDMVLATGHGMIHLGFRGRVIRIENPGTKIWVRWINDNDETHTVRHCLRILNREGICPKPMPESCDKCKKPCKEEIETRRVMEEFNKAEEIKRKAEEELINKYKKEVIVSRQLHRFFQSELKEWKQIRETIGDREVPFMYALGRDTGGTIVVAHPLRGARGCKDLQYITPRELAQAYIKLVKEKTIMVGIARVGKFKTKDTYGVGELHNISEDAILLSINDNSAWLSQHIPELSRIITYPYIIKKNNKRKGGDTDGNKEKETDKGHVGTVSKAPGSEAL